MSRRPRSAPHSRPRLRFEQAAFGIRVGFERVVPIQMIRRDVQADRDLRPKSSIVSSWKLDSSSTFHWSSLESSTIAVGGGADVAANLAGDSGLFAECARSAPS